jgi:NADH-quinone oxidoreductase subunit L
MGGLRKRMPWTFGTFLVGALALSGVPLLSGFFAKDMILGSAFAHGGTGLWLLMIGTATLTAFYTFRMLFVVFYGKPRRRSSAMEKRAESRIQESPPVMIVPMVILAVLAAIGGYVGLPEGLGLPNAIELLLHPAFADSAPAESVAGALTLELALMLASILAVGLGFAAAYWIYVRRWGLAERLTRRAGWLYNLLYEGYYVNEAYRQVIVNPLRRLGDLLSGTVEEKGIDGAVNGVARLTGFLGEGIRRLQSGLVRNYALALLLGVVALLALAMLRSVIAHGALGWW